MRLFPIVCLLALACNGQETEWEPNIVCQPDAPAMVGPTPLKRLTRSQYEHSVQDILGVTGSYAHLLDADDIIGPFATNGGTGLGQKEVYTYLTTAETVAADADIGAIDNCNLLTTPAATCASEFIETVGRRFYRRPLSADELAMYMSLYTTFGEGQHVNGLRVAVQAIMVSPEFLYHPDYEVVTGVSNGLIQPLAPFALASRLSYFLWDSVPDEALLEAAESGELLTGDGLREQTLRMLANPKAVRGITRFHLQWLGVDFLEDVQKDLEMFPQYTPEVVDGLKQETADFANYVIRHGDGELATLLSADFTVLNEAIADFYDLPDPVEPAPNTPVYLHSDRRAGILSHGSVLAAHSKVQQTSLSRRGKLVRERLSCQPIHQPPGNVNFILPDLGPNATTRERVEAHTKDPGCASCHEKMDYIGFGFEQMDAIGQYREFENGRLIDASGELTQTDVDGLFIGAPELSDKLVDSNQVRACVSRQWLTYALGRDVQVADGCSMSDAYEAMHKPNNLRELLLAIVMSNSFRNRRIETGGAQ